MPYVIQLIVRLGTHYNISFELNRSRIVDMDVREMWDYICNPVESEIRHPYHFSN